MNNNLYQNGNNNVTYQGNIKQYNTYYNSNNTNNKTNNHSLPDYCQLSQPSKKMARKLVAIISFTADLISVITFAKNFKLFSNCFIVGDLKNTQHYFSIVYICIIVSMILSFILILLIAPLFKSKKEGINNKIYYKDKFYYDILLKRCPICNARTTLSNDHGTITFNCTKSNNHSLSADITDLNIFINNSN